MHIIVVTQEEKIRLDRYLKRLNPKLTQGIIEQALRHGKIKVNNKKAESSLRIRDGDEIFIIQSLLMDSEKEPNQKIFSANVIKLAEKLKKKYLIFENEYFLVINKPAGLATQGGSKINLSIDDSLNYLNNLENSNLKLVHRLDKETSGILLIAKSHYAANRLAQGFQNKIIQKKYLALVHVYPESKMGEISNQIAKNREGIYQKVQEDNKNGKLAITQYKLIKKIKNFSLIEFIPLTGRTHQLRIHAQMLGCPIVGDNKYGIKNSIIDNMLLHASNIVLPCEIFKEEFRFEATLPEYFQAIIG